MENDFPPTPHEMEISIHFIFFLLGWLPCSIRGVFCQALLNTHQVMLLPYGTSGIFCLAYVRTHQVVLVPYGTSGVFCRALVRTHEVILVHGLDHEVEHQVHTDYQHVPQHDVPPPFQF